MAAAAASMSFTKRSEAEFMDRCLYSGPFATFVPYPWALSPHDPKTDPSDATRQIMCQSLYEQVKDRTLMQREVRRATISVQKTHDQVFQRKSVRAFILGAMNRTSDQSKFPTEGDCWNDRDERVCDNNFSVQDVYHGK